MLFGTAKPTQRSFDFARRAATIAPLAHLSASSGWQVAEENIMGTAVRVELWCAEPAAGEAAVQAVMREMHRIDRTFSPHKAQSELSLVNRDAAVRPVHLSEEMFSLLQRAAHFSALSGGAFDITYASVGQLYDYRLGVQPSAAALAKARAAVGWQKLLLDTRARTVRFAQAGMRIDLGGFAKGHAVDKAVALLQQRGVAHAYVSAGGDSRVLGDHRGRPWTIAIRDPRRAGEVVAVLPLEDCAISTSGDYERFFMQGGVRCHHLIDPATGLSPSSLCSVTILGPDGLTTEGLSKSVFVLGVQRGLQLVESQPGVDAVLVDAAGTLHFSSGLLDGNAPPAGAEIPNTAITRQ